MVSWLLKHCAGDVMIEKVSWDRLGGARGGLGEGLMEG